jgi:transcription initiation factor TFIIIB Brf1 subunit/transcription initiation factor TFIIB
LNLSLDVALTRAPGVKAERALQPAVYTARDRLENEKWLEELQQVADGLEMDAETRTVAEDVFLSSVPESDRSKRATLAASLYAAGLVAGDQRSQGDVAEAADVSRITVQGQWKELLEAAGLDAPDW